MFLVSSFVGCSRISARVSRAVISEQALEVCSNLLGERECREREGERPQARTLSLSADIHICEHSYFLYIYIYFMYIFSMWRLQPERCGNRCHTVIIITFSTFIINLSENALKICIYQKKVVSLHCISKEIQNISNKPNQCFTYL